LAERSHSEESTGAASGFPPTTAAGEAPLDPRDGFLVQLDDTLRPLSDASDITLTAARMLGQHLAVNRCAYATVEADEDTFELVGNFNVGVDSIVGRYTFRQFGEECLRLMRAGEPYVVSDSSRDPRVTPAERPSYVATAIEAVICVPVLKSGRFVAAMAVHSAVPRTWHRDEVGLVQRVASRCWESMERARVTQSLERSERQFRAMVNAIPNLAWMARPDGWIYWYNEQWYQYTGTTLEDMAGWRWESVHHPDAIADVTTRWQQSIAEGRPFEMVFPLRGADGHYRRFLTRVNPVRDAHGDVGHWFGTNTDIEDECRATELNAELRERERIAREEAELQKRLLYSLFMQAPTLIAILRGPDHIVELANPPICESWGRTQPQVLHRSLFDSMPELRGQIFRSLLDEVFRTGIAHAGHETPVVIDRGEAAQTRYFNFVYSPFSNIDGVVEGVFMIASDVTDQVLARNQVSQLRDAAEAANRAKDEFLAILGHELRNPLSPILTALHLMNLRGSDDTQHERTIIERQVRHLTRLVDDLLDVSRIARGKVKLTREVVEIAEITARAIEMISPLLEQRRHALVVDIPKHGLAVAGDAIRLSQIVSNLVANAAKYTAPGGQITIAADGVDDEVVLQVRDNGVGIAAEVLPQVFDLFVQGQQSLDRSQGGLGLGLTIVRNLTEAHGGRVSAHSEGPGLGSQFVVRLPRVTAVAAKADRPAAGGSSVAHPRVRPGSVRVLVVDDNIDAAMALSEVLKLHNHDARAAHDAPAALRVAAEFQPTVAILDLGLPVMDGYELAARLRTLPGLEAIRLIALTGYGQEADRTRTQLAGFELHLVKPVDFHAVEAALVP